MKTATEKAKDQEYFHARNHDKSIADLYYMTDKSGAVAGFAITLSKTDWQWSAGPAPRKDRIGSSWQACSFDELPKNVQNCVLGIF